MKRRIFIAINFPEKIKKNLLSHQEEIGSLFSQGVVRWGKEDNLHLTLVFIGYVSDQEVGEACKTVKEVAGRHSSFSLAFNRIGYGPPKKMPPRMIWAEGEALRELSSLKEDLENSLSNSGICFEAENREFRPHVTLGRIRTWEWKKIDPEERPSVEREISLDFEVKSIEAMESRLKRGGAEYAILESAQLK